MGLCTELPPCSRVRPLGFGAPYSERCTVLVIWKLVNTDSLCSITIHFTMGWKIVKMAIFEELGLGSPSLGTWKRSLLV